VGQPIYAVVFKLCRILASLLPFQRKSTGEGAVLSNGSTWERPSQDILRGSAFEASAHTKTGRSDTASADV